MLAQAAPSLPPGCPERRSPSLCLGRHPKGVSAFCPTLKRKQGLGRLSTPADLPLVPNVGTGKRSTALSQGLTIGKASETQSICAEKPGRGPAMPGLVAENQSEQPVSFPPPDGSPFPSYPP